MYLSESSTPVARAAALVPEEFDIFFGGGRGGGKTRAVLELAGRHAEQYGSNARIVYLRASHKALQEVIADALLLFTGSDPNLKFNKQDQIITFSNGATLTFDVLEDEQSYAKKYQGRSLSLLIIDEATAWADPRILDLMQSNLRKQGVACRTLWAANPGGAGHGWVAERYVFPSPGHMVPFYDAESERHIVYLHSIYTENPYVDHVPYLKRLKTACRGDDALFKAWTEGDWRVVRGAFFAGALTSHNEIDIAPFDLSQSPLRPFLGYDHGTRAPYVCYLAAEARDSITIADRYLPRGSVLLLDECTSATPDDLEDGGGMQIPDIALDILAMCSVWNAPARGFGDDALFSDLGVGNHGKYFADSGVRFAPAKKGLRRDGWSVMREYLAAAQHGEDPCCLINKRCWYAWSTIPYLAASTTDMEDLAKSRRDHAADAVRYTLLKGGDDFVSVQHGSLGEVMPANSELIALARAQKTERVIERMKKRGVTNVNLAALRQGTMRR